MENQWVSIFATPELRKSGWGAESPADNAIRRFLASLSLTRLGELRGSVEMREAARRNPRFNLGRYFRDIGGGRGTIVDSSGAKLGAAAIAALAIIESPARGEFLGELTMLAAGMESLADEDAGFRTFFFPAERDGDNWNFYSGEALLFWGEALRRGAQCAPSLDRCVAALARCRTRHLQARNPAFVPWYTQACNTLFTHTGRRTFADHALEVSDWLLPMQQWHGLAADLKGCFYDPRRPEFGPLTRPPPERTWRGLPMRILLPAHWETPNAKPPMPGSYAEA